MSDQEERKDPKEIIEAEIGITKIDLEMTPVPIGDILEELMPQGLQSSVEEVIDQKIVIHSIRLFVGSYGPAAFVVFTDDNGELFNFIIGQKIVLPKLLAVMEKLPVSATIKRHEGGQFGYYYDIE
jgi:hypothetical protein